MKNTGTLKVTTPTDREIVLTRIFDAPRHLVFEAFSKPELLKRWFGPRGWSLVVCEVDFKVGGGFRFVLRGPDSQVTTVLVEQGGKTTFTATVLAASREARDAVIKSGMEHGAAECYDKLAELLPSLQTQAMEKSASEA